MGEGKKKRLVEKSDVRGALTRRTEIFFGIRSSYKNSSDNFLSFFRKPEKSFYNFAARRRFASVEGHFRPPTFSAQERTLKSLRVKKKRTRVMTKKVLVSDGGGLAFDLLQRHGLLSG